MWIIAGNEISNWFNTHDNDAYSDLEGKAEKVAGNIFASARSIAISIAVLMLAICLLCFVLQPEKRMEHKAWAISILVGIILLSSICAIYGVIANL